MTPLFPEALGSHNRFFSFYFLVVAVICFVVLQVLYRRRFGLLLNAIRDDEDKAEAMGLPTTRCKVVAWSVAAFFLALTGGAYGNFIGFIDPLDTAFSGATLGVWMILMAIMGGRGSLWGPVLGAMVFHVTQELFWTFLLGWHRVAMGLLIVVIVMFLPDGILGWFRERRGERGAGRGQGSMSALLQVDGVSKSFGGVEANRNITIGVEAGAVYGLIGPNGSGKTTLFNGIVGQHPVDGGDGDLRRYPRGADDGAGHRPARPVAHLPADARLPGHELPGEHAGFGRAPHGGRRTAVAPDLSPP